MADIYLNLLQLLENYAGGKEEKNGLVESMKKCRIAICHLEPGVDEKSIAAAKCCIKAITDCLRKMLNSGHKVAEKNSEQEQLICGGFQLLCNAVATGHLVSPVEYSQLFLANLAQVFMSSNYDTSLTPKCRSLYSAVLFQCCTRHEDFASHLCLFLLEEDEANSNYSDFPPRLAKLWLSEVGERSEYLEWNFFLLEALIAAPTFGLVMNKLVPSQRLEVFKAFCNSVHGAAASSSKFLNAFADEFLRYSFDVLKASYSIDCDSCDFQCLALLLEFFAEVSAVHRQAVTSSPNAGRLWESCLGLVELAARLPDKGKTDDDKEKATSPYGFKGHVIQLLSNLVHKNAENKRNLLERRDVLTALVELMRRLDLNNPFASQWCFLAIRNSCEDCPEMAVAIMQLMTGTDFLARLGISLPEHNRNTNAPATVAEQTAPPSKPVETFHYSRNDFVVSDDAANGKSTLFGDMVRSTFDEIASIEGILRFRCKDVTYRYLESEHGRRYVAALIVGRATQRRAAAHFDSVTQKPSAEGFNFSKCRREEIMFAMRCTDDLVYEDEGTYCGGKQTPHHERYVLMVNVSPIGDPSLLLVPDRLNVVPQILTPDAIRYSLHFLLLSGDINFRVGFNSLCAFASVNHLHLHIWSAPYSLYVESTKCFPIEGSEQLLYEARVPESGPVPAFVVDLASVNNDVDLLSQLIFLLCDSLVIRDIPHNIMITWGRRLSDNAGSTIRCFIWPKRKISSTEKDKPLCAAVGELSGYLVVKDEELYNSISASWWEEESAEQACRPADDFSSLRDAFVSIARDIGSSNKRKH